MQRKLYVATAAFMFMSCSSWAMNTDKKSAPLKKTSNIIEIGGQSFEIPQESILKTIRAIPTCDGSDEYSTFGVNKILVEKNMQLKNLLEKENKLLGKGEKNSYTVNQILKEFLLKNITHNTIKKFSEKESKEIAKKLLNLKSINTLQSSLLFKLLDQKKVGL